MSDPGAVRTARTQSEIRELALVLAAAGIEHQVTGRRGEWRLVVAPEDAEAASAAIEAYERERAAGPAPGDVAFESYAGFHMAAALWAFYVVTGPAWRESAWAKGGAADAARLLHGEPWRAVTALTLHADGVHVLGNAVGIAVLVTAVCQQLGPGVGLWLVLLAGAGGNALTAAVHGRGHVSVGASTAIFGAIGILAALRVVGPRRAGLGATRWWVVIAASLVLLTLLGSGPNADLLAHALGLLAGGALGLVAALTLHAALPAWLEWLLVATAGAAVTAAWRAAL